MLQLLRRSRARSSGRRVVDERAAASLGVPHVATCPDLMPSVQLNRSDLGTRGEQPGHEAMQISRMKDPGNQQNIDTSLSRMTGHRAYIRFHHCSSAHRPATADGTRGRQRRPTERNPARLGQTPSGAGQSWSCQHPGLRPKALRALSDTTWQRRPRPSIKRRRVRWPAGSWFSGSGFAH